MFYCNKLPLKHTFAESDESPVEPSAFSGHIGKNLVGSLSNSDVIKFQFIFNLAFPVLPQPVPEDLSSDQCYSNRIFLPVIFGEVDEDLHLLEAGELCHFRWLTLTCKILRRSVSVCNPSKSLQTMAQFCIKVDFPFWLDIKKNATISDGCVHYFNMIRKIATFSHQTIRKIGSSTMQRNSFFAHPENVLLSMLGNTYYEVRGVTAYKIQNLRCIVQSVSHSTAAV